MSEESSFGSSFFESGTKFAAKAGNKFAENDAVKAAKEGAIKGASDGAQKGLSRHLTDKYGSGSESKTPISSSLENKDCTTKTFGSFELEATDIIPENTHSKGIKTVALPKIKLPKLINRSLAVKSHPLVEAQRAKTRARTNSVKITKKIEDAWEKELIAVANFNFKGELPCDLDFKKGDKIRVHLRTDKEFDWWEGQIAGKIGIFPANYVTILTA